MTILVTAASGHLGRLVVDALLDRGVAPAGVVATSRRPESLADLAESGVAVARLDYDDAASVEAALDGVDRMLLVSGTDPGARLEQHRAVIDAAARAGVGLIAYTSIFRADTSPLPLAPDHKATEELLAASGVPWVALRNSWYSENYLSTVEQARATGEVVASAGDGRVASASRVDYAAAAAAVLSEEGHAGNVYELGGASWSFDDLAATIGAVVGREVAYRPVSTDEHVAILESVGLDAGTAGFVAALDSGIRDGALADAPDDLERLIGRPATPLAETLAAA